MDEETDGKWTLMGWIKSHDGGRRGMGTKTLQRGEPVGPNFAPTPTQDVVEQYAFADYKPLPVVVDGIVPVVNVPAKRTVLGATSQNLGTPQPIVPWDPKIKRITLIAPFTGFFIGSQKMFANQGAATNPALIPLPALYPVVLESLNNEALHAFQNAASVTANGLASIGLITEYWAD